ncbi:hypothetical protein MHB42_06135 [Lysinibacillus sp. FSL K6-0232]|uniref:hypothetical protein n=1 Tax=Lysinibacillus sp. FSL K6-0232 TaxID=2921425 RepID=UPI0030FB736A
MTEHDQIDEDAISILLHKILYELKKLSNQVDGAQVHTIRSAIQYLESHYQQPITLHDLADYAGLSSYHF